MLFNSQRWIKKKVLKITNQKIFLEKPSGTFLILFYKNSSKSPWEQIKSVFTQLFEWGNKIVFLTPFCSCVLELTVVFYLQCNKMLIFQIDLKLQRILVLLLLLVPSLSTELRKSLSSRTFDDDSWIGSNFPIVTSPTVNQSNEQCVNDTKTQLAGIRDGLQWAVESKLS